MANTFRSGEQNEVEQIDPFGNAVELAQVAEAHARKSKDVSDMLAASTQWLAIAQIHKELTAGGEPPPRRVGFTGGNEDE